MTFFNVVWYLIQEREFCQFILTCLFLAKVMKVPVLRSKFVSFGSFLHDFVSEFEKRLRFCSFTSNFPRKVSENTFSTFLYAMGPPHHLKIDLWGRKDLKSV